MHLGELALRVGPILGFLVCITVVAELADRLRVFATVARARRDWHVDLSSGSGC